jgi:hypothetical protein
MHDDSAHASRQGIGTMTLIEPKTEAQRARATGVAALGASLGAQKVGSTSTTPREMITVRLAGLEWRALQAEVGWAGMRSRRLYRVVNVLVAMLRRPWRVLGMMGELRAAMVRRSTPVLPEPPSPRAYLAELAGWTAAGRKPRPLPYPHIRVAHVGRLAMFEMVAPHLDLSDVDLDKELETGFDMLLIEPGVDDPLDGVEPGTIDRFKEAGIPVLFIARTTAHLEYPILPQVDLVLCEDPDLARPATDLGHNVLHIHPSVDDTIHNPIGWKHQPDPTLLVIADHPGIETDLETLAPITDQISLHGPAIPGLNPARHHPERPVGSDQTTTAKSHLAVYTTPQLTATPTSHIQLVLELVATGTPVITAPNPTLTTLLEDHYLPAETTTDIIDHLQTLAHPPTRERHSVPARRHLLTHHTRKHRFEEILTHLDIPTIPTPRISILLATKRPENIEHALNNVTTQNWPNKELLLILHGEENFDLDHIHTLTSQLPYPTQILPCPSTWTLGDCLNTGLDHATGTYISKMDDDDHYGPNHLLDLHTAHTYSNADVTGKLATNAYLGEFDLTVSQHVIDPEKYHHHVSGATLTMPRDLSAHFNFLRRSSRVDTTLLQRVIDSHGTLYVTHSYGFVITRNKHGHTWHTDSYQRFLTRADEVENGVSRRILDA